MDQQKLSHLEQEVMNIVWELEECSVREVLENIRREKPLAYTTVATILQRLHDKGMVTRNKREKTIMYRPKVSKRLYGAGMLGSFINNFFDSFGEVATASFAESLDKLPQHKRKQILEMLDHYEKR